MTAGSTVVPQARPIQSSKRSFFWLLAIAVLGIVTLLYFPVWHAGFVWDDKLCLHDNGWLRYGDDWKHFVLRDYCEWQNYFRPLTVILFTLEVRAFDSTPGPMHLVSLAIHLLNALLVGFLALRLTGNAQRSPSAQWLAGLSMLLYGVHPALIEPVVWIGCQAEGMVTLFSLLAILLNEAIDRPLARASAVAMCFFLAAGFKESAMALPPLLIMIDLMTGSDDDGDSGWAARIRRLWSRQWTVYCGMLIAGLAYLAIRRWALGEFVHSLTNAPFFSIAHLQEVCAIYVTYLRILVWPMLDLGPVHFSTIDFGLVTAHSLAVDILALGILAAALFGFWKRHPLGGYVLCATAALVPVLHLMPVAFDGSLYHERYVMMGLAAICVLMPSTFDKKLFGAHSRYLRIAAPLALATWFGFAVVNVGATITLWGSDVTLWQWALRENPDSIVAKDHLLTAYMDKNDHARARALATSIIAEGVRCPGCLLNAAYVGLAEKDVATASTALDKLKTDRALAYDESLLRGYIFAVGQLLELQDDIPGAENAYREAVRMDPLNPVGQMTLAMLIAQKGNVPEARSIMDKALALSAPDEREERRQMFEAKLAQLPAAKPQP